jgi:sugar lactone lactonase YvrE
MKNMPRWWGRFYRVFSVMLFIMAVILALGGLEAFGVLAQDDSDFTYAGKRPAPAFPDGLAWLNVPAPLSIEDDLRGKIVLLDFWTYGCINCIHVIPDLKRLEAEFPTEIVVIGVHSAKFDNEGVTANIRQIVQRYEVTHPIVNDADFQVWSAYSARAWPSLYLIDPLGRVVGRHEGEGVYEVLQPVIATMVAEYGAAGLLDPSPITLTPETEGLDALPLRFPGAVLTDAAGGRLFIADSGHHRIIVVSLEDFSVQAIIGGREAGASDGDFATARFHAPQGLALDGDTLYVADTNNHLIRAVDLQAQTVSTIAGTGRMGVGFSTGGAAREVELRSPWGLALDGQKLYIAMAGSHQLWTLHLPEASLSVLAGNGREDLIDGPRLDALLAQPSGLALDGETLYFTDSESSSIRRVDLREGGRVETVVGPVTEEQGRLFAFGDEDGSFDQVRLQHPLGITLAEDGLLYFSDTYNNKIKVLDPRAKTSQTLTGRVEGGYFDGALTEALFDEPSGMAYHDGRLFVADTNNHAIRVLDLEAGTVASLVFPNVNLLVEGEEAVGAPLAEAAPTAEATPSIDSVMGKKEIVLPLQTVGVGEGTILVDAPMPFGYKLNGQAPFTALWPEDDVVTVAADQRDYRVVTPALPIEFQATFSAGQTELKVDLIIYWCEAINETLCFVERASVTLPVQVTAEAPARALNISYQLVPPSAEDGLGG